MRFPCKFSFYVGSGGPTETVTTALPATFTPPTQPPSKKDSQQLVCKPISAQGWPVHRTVIAYKFEGSDPAPDVDCDVYFYEDSTKAWYKLNASTLTLKNGHLTWTDLASVIEAALTQQSLDNGTYSPGAIELYFDVKVAALSQVDGLYHFAAGMDLTTGNL